MCGCGFIHCMHDFKFFFLFLQVWFQDGEDNKTENYNRCFKNDGIYLPPTGYFGISAATGGLSG